MTTFNYTDFFTADSSLTPEVYYDANGRRLIVNLDPADADDVDVFYAYDNVPESVFKDYRNARSKGAFYNLEVKRKYGPGVLLGEFYDVFEIEVERRPEPVTSANSVGGAVTFAPGGIVTSAAGSAPLILSAPPVEPEVEKQATEYVPLSVAVNNGNLRKFVVAFEVNGITTDYTLYETDWNAAAVAVETLGDQLGQTFNVKGLSVVD